MSLSKWLRYNFTYFIFAMTALMCISLIFALNSFYKEIVESRAFVFQNAQQNLGIAIRQKNYSQIENILFTLNKFSGIENVKICSTDNKFIINNNFTSCSSFIDLKLPISGQLNLYIAVIEKNNWLTKKLLVTILPLFFIIIIFVYLLRSKASLFNHELLEPLRNIEMKDPGTIKIYEIQEISRQIKEKAKLKTELELEKERSRIAKQVAHDIRSPLAVINHIISKFQTAHKDNQLLNLSLHRINAIAEDLLHTSKSSKTPPEVFSFNSLVEQIVSEKRLLTHHSINLDCDDKIDFQVNARQVDIARTLSNLLNNAIEALGESNILNGKIQVTLKEHSGDAILIIEDNGLGIDDTILNNLEHSFSTKQHGNGLGLKHARFSIIEAGGEFFISKGKQCGTSVVISLPLKQKLICTRAKSSINVLIDDDDMVRYIWEDSAKKKNISLKTYSKVDQLRLDLKNFDNNCVFFIDSDLNDIKGETIAKEIYDLGMTNIFMASGHGVDDFKHLHYIRGNIGKAPPF